MKYRKFKPRPGQKRSGFSYVKKGMQVGSFAANMVAQVPKLVKGYQILRGLVNAEKKYTDINLGTTVSSTGSVQLVNQIAQGDDSFNRNGISILHKYLKFNISAVMNASATCTFVRILLVQDTANQGSTPAGTDVLTTFDVDSQKNSDNQKRFVIIREKRFQLSINGNRGATIKWYVPTNFHCRYSASGATTVLQNAMYLLMVSGEATNTPTIGVTVRNAFYDN